MQRGCTGLISHDSVLDASLSMQSDAAAAFCTPAYRRPQPQVYQHHNILESLQITACSGGMLI
jgi:hypothetical protein